jgi:hypothetical protein
MQTRGKGRVSLYVRTVVVHDWIFLLKILGVEVNLTSLVVYIHYFARWREDSREERVSSFVDKKTHSLLRPSLALSLSLKREIL